jgi:hypothetical protein
MLTGGAGVCEDILMKYRWGFGGEEELALGGSCFPTQLLFAVASALEGVIESLYYSLRRRIGDCTGLPRQDQTLIHQLSARSLGSQLFEKL